MKEITKWEYLFFWGEESQIQELGEKGWKYFGLRLLLEYADRH